MMIARYGAETGVGASYDVVVVGLGAHGAATLYQLARRGVRALGVDRWSPPHARGSSHGETRATRQGVGEGEAYAPLALRSHEIWRELEAATGRRLLLTCGALFIGPGDGGGHVHGTVDFVRRSGEVAAEFGVPHERLDAAEMGARFLQLAFRGDERGYYEPGAGLVYPERCIAAQLSEAERLGAVVRRDTQVRAVRQEPSAVQVDMGGETIGADRVVLATGAWLPGMIGADLADVRIQPQTLHWFAVDDARAYAADRTPVVSWVHGPGAEESFYAFPITPDTATPGLKAAMETQAEIASPADLERDVPAARGERLFDDHLRGRLKGVRRTPLRSQACLYTTTPDAGFRVRPWSQCDRLLYVSACSGHGFKHSAALGERIAESVTQPAALSSVM